MDPIILRAWSSIVEWCDGGPIPDREEIREAFMLLVQQAATGEPVAPHDATPAENVIPFRTTTRTPQ